MSSNLIAIQQDLESNLIAAGVEAILPDTVKIETFAKCAAIAMASNSDLMNADKSSVIMALSKCANDGLLPDNKEAALVTFNKNVAPKGQPKQWAQMAQYMPMIDGVMKRARMSGQITLLSSKAVMQDDQFDYWMDENGEHINYRPQYGSNDFKLAFAFAKLNTGELVVEVMSKSDIDKVRASSKTGTYGPWADWYDRMACKVVMHRLARRLPNASEIVQMCETGMNMNFSKAGEIEIQQAPISDPIKELKLLTENVPEEKVLKWLRLESMEDLTPEIAEKAVIAKRNAKQ